MSGEGSQGTLGGCAKDSRKLIVERQCDEARPLCYLCRTGGWPCSYDFANTVRSHSSSGRDNTVVISALHSVNCSPRHGSTRGEWLLRRSRKAPLGQGVFYTLAPPTRRRRSTICTAAFKAPPPPELLTTSQTRLAARWANMLESSAPDARPFTIFGTWFVSLTQLIGSSEALDLAALFVLDSHRIYRTNRKVALTNTEPTQDSATNAMKALRKTMNVQSNGVNNAATVVATGLLCAAEVCGQSFLLQTQISSLI